MIIFTIAVFIVSVIAVVRMFRANPKVSLFIWGGLFFGPFDVGLALTHENLLQSAEIGGYGLFVGFLLVAVGVICLGALALFRAVQNFTAGISGPRTNVFVQHQHVSITGPQQ